jgi:hypothetical protein
VYVCVWVLHVARVQKTEPMDAENVDGFNVAATSVSEARNEERP